MARNRSSTLTVVGGFIALLAAYFLYEQTLGRFTDFSHLTPEEAQPLPDEDGSVQEPRRRESDIAAIRGFGPDCDELNAPLTLESRDKNVTEGRAGRGIGLYIYAVDYEILKENPNRIRMHPFSLVYISARAGGVAEDDEIYAVSGDQAYLEFDRPVELTKLSGLKPLRGWVEGQVEVVSRRTADPNDDISLFTPSKLFYDEAKNLIWSDGAIRLVEGGGDSRVTGEKLEVELHPAQQPGQPIVKRKAEAKRIRLYQKVRFDLMVDRQADFLGAAASSPKNVKESKDAKSGGKTPLTIQSAGPFVFDLDTDKATFSKRVEALRTNAGDPAKTGTIDQLRCDDLTLCFTRDKKPTKTAEKNPQDKGLKLLSAEATGRNVILQSDSQQLMATGNYLFHDANARRAILRGEKEMVAFHDNSVIHARTLTIEQSEDQQIKALVADGPDGWLEITEKPTPGAPAVPAGEKKGNRLKITWQGKLTLASEPNSPNRLLTIRDNVELDDYRAAVRSNELRVWLAPQSRVQGPADPARNLQPVRFEATGNVSARLDAAAIVAETLVTEIVDKKPTAAASPAAVGKSTPVAKAAGAAADGPAKPKEKKDGPPLEVVARRVRAMVDRDGAKSTLVSAWAEGDVLVTQPPTEPGQAPLEIRGNFLQFDSHDTGDVMKVTSGGKKPASIKTADLTLVSNQELLLNEVQNSVRAAGQGYLIRVNHNDLLGKKIEKPQPLRVDWKEAMSFDGKHAIFEGDAQARQGGAVISCGIMDVKFDQRINFSEARNQRRGKEEIRAKIETVDCDKNVIVIDTEYREKVFLRHTQIRAVDLRFDNLDQNVLATGPGDVRIIEPSQPKRDANGRMAPPTLPFELTNVRFNRRMDANNQRQTATFREQVHILHAPLKRHDEVVDETNLPKDGLTVRARESAEMGTRQASDGRRYRDFRAIGDVQVHAQEYWGQCERLTYDQQKELLVFEGDVPNKPKRKVQFYRQVQRGAEPESIVARIIRYNRVTGDIRTEGVEGLQIQAVQPPSKDRK